jgi:hypothetical protein
VCAANGTDAWLQLQCVFAGRYVQRDPLNRLAACRSAIHLDRRDRLDPWAAATRAFSLAVETAR